MSREERRNYERMMRNMERGPSLPAAAKARAERNAARRAARQGSKPTVSGPFTRRLVVMAVIIALAAGYLAFSIVWPTMPLAAYVGAAVSVAALGLQIGFRLLQLRIAARR